MVMKPNVSATRAVGDWMCSFFLLRISRVFPVLWWARVGIFPPSLLRSTFTITFLSSALEPSLTSLVVCFFATVASTGLCDVQQEESTSGVKPSSLDGDDAKNAVTWPPTTPLTNSDVDFETSVPSVVRVAVGTTTYLTCRPRALRNKTVSHYKPSLFLNSF